MANPKTDAPNYFAKKRSLEELKKADLLLISGTNAEILPAAGIPKIAKINGAEIIEIIFRPSHFTTVNDIFLNMKDTEVVSKIGEMLYL